MSILMTMSNMLVVEKETYFMWASFLNDVADLWWPQKVIAPQFRITHPAKYSGEFIQLGGARASLSLAMDGSVARLRKVFAKVEEINSAVH